MEYLHRKSFLSITANEPITMPHDPLFERRIAEALLARAVKAEPKKMFGGVAFMVRGHMTVGITNKSDLMVRFEGARHAEIAKWPGTKPMTFGKGDMRGFLFVDPAAVQTSAMLGRWIDLALAHNAMLPEKKDGAKAVRPKPQNAAVKIQLTRKVAKKG